MDKNPLAGVGETSLIPMYAAQGKLPYVVEQQIFLTVTTEPVLRAQEP